MGGDDDPFEELRDPSRSVRFGDPGRENVRSHLEHMLDDDEIMNDVDDADTMAWEHEQMKKSGISDRSSYEQDERTRGHARLGGRSTVTTSASLPSLIDSMRQSVQQMTQQRDQSSQEAQQLHAQVNIMTEEIEQQKQSLQKLLTQSGDLRGYKSFVHDLMKCFELNLPTISRLESQLSKLMEDLLQSYEWEQVQFIADRLAGDGEHTTHLTTARDLFRHFVQEIEAPLCEAMVILQEDLPPLQEILDFFSEWQEKYPSAYESAYCEQSLWVTVSPIVRTELLFWDPLLGSTLYTSAKEHHTSSFTEQQWFRTLQQQSVLFYQNELLTQLVEEEVLPKVKDLMLTPWDICSLDSSRRFAQMVRDLHIFFDGSSTNSHDAVDGLLIKFLSKFHSHLQTLPVVSQPEEMDPHVYQAIKMLQSLRLWADLIPASNMESAIRQLGEVHIFGFLQRCLERLSATELLTLLQLLEDLSGDDLTILCRLTPSSALLLHQIRSLHPDVTEIASTVGTIIDRSG